MMRVVLFAMLVLLLVGCSGPATPSATALTTPGVTIASTALAVVDTPKSSPAPTAVPTSRATPTLVPTVTLRATAALSSSPIASPTLALGAPGTPTPTNKVKAQLAENVSSDYQPVNPTANFSTSSRKVYLAFSTTNLPANSSLSSVWVAEKVNADVTPDYVIDKAELNVSGSQSGDFSLSRPTAGFPTGQYRVDLYLDDTLIGSYSFTVK